jgi:hypothetical protein
LPTTLTKYPSSARSTYQVCARESGRYEFGSGGFQTLDSVAEENWVVIR